MNGLTKTHASSVQHTEQEQVAVFFSWVFRLLVGLGASSDLDWDGESEFGHGLDFRHLHLDIFIDVFSQAGQLDSSLVWPVSVVLQDNFGKDSVSSSSFNDLITVFDDFASIDFHALSSIAETTIRSVLQIFGVIMIFVRPLFPKLVVLTIIVCLTRSRWWSIRHWFIEITRHLRHWLLWIR